MAEDDLQRWLEMCVSPHSPIWVHLTGVSNPISDFILAACDVEGNFLVVKAYEYTTLLSCMLLDAWAIPVCIFFSWLYMRPKYHWTQLVVRIPIRPRSSSVSAAKLDAQGIFICVGGLGMLVASDEITDKDWPALSRAKGDVFMLVGASLYGFSESPVLLLLREV